MKIKLSLLFSLALISGCSDDTPVNNTNPPPFVPSPFHRTVGGSVSEEGQSIIQTSDGGFAVTGITTSFGSGGVDVYLVKLDRSGALEWTRTFGGSGDDYGISIVQTFDGGYVIAGYTNSFGAGLNDVYLIKLDGSGTLQWTRTVGGSSTDYGFKVVQTADSGFVTVGRTHSFGAGLSDVYIVKLDGSSTLQWARTVGGSAEESGYDIIKTTDGGFAVTGSTRSYGAGDNDVYILKLNNSGSLLWSRTVGQADSEYGYSLVQTTDGGYTAAGISFNLSTFKGYVVKVNASGVLQWTRIIQNTTISILCSSIIQDADGNYVLTGKMDSELSIAKLNQTGDLVWIKTVDSTDYGLDIIGTTDGGYVISGLTFSTHYDMCVIRFDDQGNTCSTVNPKGAVNGTGGSSSSGGVGAPSTGITGIGGSSGTGGTLQVVCDSD